MKPAITIRSKEYLSKFLLKPLVSAILVVSALATATTALASECSCNTSGLPTTTIEESNDGHPNQLILKNDKAYYQLRTQNGQILQDRLYEVTPYENGQIIAKRDGRVGLIDVDGQLLFDFKYDDIKILPANLYLLSKFQGAHRMDALVRGANDWLYPASGQLENKVTIEPLYHDETNDISYLKVTQKGKVGIISDKKQTLIPSVYDELSLLDTCPNERLFMRVRSGDKVGLMDQYQQIIVPLETNQTIENFNEALQVFKVSNNHFSPYDNEDKVISDTLIKGNGKTLVKSDSPIVSLSNDLYQFSQAGKYGVINAAADILVPASFEQIAGSWDAPIIVTQQGRQGILSQDKVTKQLRVAKYYDQLQSIDVTDQTLSQLQAAAIDEQEIEATSDDERNSNEAYSEDEQAQTETEESLAEAEYDYERVQQEVSAAADAIEASEPDYSNRDYNFDPKLYIAKLNGKFGLIDAKDSLRIPFLYDEMSESTNALLVKKAQEYGLLTTHNETIAGVIYDTINTLESTDLGLLYVLSLGNEQSIIDSAGRKLLPLSSYRMAAIGADNYGLDNRIIANSEGKYGLLSAGFDAVLLAPYYEKIERELSNNSIIAQLEGKKVLIDAYGQVMPTDFSEYREIYELDVTNTLLVTKDNGKQGIITNEGKILVEPKYDGIQPILLGYYIDDNKVHYYIVENEGYYGLLNNTGKTVIRPKYSQMTPFYYSKFLLVSDPKSDLEEPKFGLVDNKGTVVKDFKYDTIYESDYGEVSQIVLIMIANDSVEIYDNKLKLIKKMSLQKFKEEVEG